MRLDAPLGVRVSGDPMPRSAAADLLARLGRQAEAAAERKQASALAARNAAFL
jgi:predicted RNA polymerase sigma factor